MGWEAYTGFYCNFLCETQDAVNLWNTKLFPQGVELVFFVHVVFCTIFHTVEFYGFILWHSASSALLICIDLSIFFLKINKICSRS